MECLKHIYIYVSIYLIFCVDKYRILEREEETYSTSYRWQKTYMQSNPIYIYIRASIQKPEYQLVCKCWHKSPHCAGVLLSRTKTATLWGK